jgi:hypothetical protein
MPSVSFSARRRRGGRWPACSRMSPGGGDPESGARPRPSSCRRTSWRHLHRRPPAPLSVATAQRHLAAEPNALYPRWGPLPVLFRFGDELWPLPDASARLIAQALQERRSAEAETEALSKELATAVLIEDSLGASDPHPIDLTPGEADLLLNVLVRHQLDASDAQLRSFYIALRRWVGRSPR